MDLNAEPSPATPIHLPPSLPYPITISSLLPTQQVSRGQTVLWYSYTLKDDFSKDASTATINSTGGKQNKEKGREEKGYSTWECTLDGELVRWGEGVTAGVVLTDSRNPIAYIQQPCDHPVQFHGMCAVCGIDLAGQTPTTNPVNGYKPTSEGVQIEHNESGIKVSLDKANSLALTHRKTLLDHRKLILIIDLDQTIIQTGCDLTTGKWMDECYGPSWGLVHIGPDGRGTGGTGGIRDDPHNPKLLELEGPEKEEMQMRRLANPNAEAIKDIWRFQLDDEDTVGHDNQGRKWTRKGRQGVWFYVKPRPSLDRFLQTLSGLYELHVYTAGTRRYANAICTCIDPTGKYFSERILSRNESGSASVKSLKRLFPTDESMVVVIDDRWEVWAHGRNLVKVVPYAFYPNTGDINSAFVQPRATDVEPATRTAPSSSPDSSSKATASAPTQTGAIELVKSSEDPDEVQELQQEAASREVESQVTEAPLAKRQEELDKEDESVLRDVPDRAGQGEGEKEHKRAALVDDDRELYRVDKVLREIHARFYQTYDSADKKIAFQPASEPDNRILYDVRHIIPHMRRKVLGGCVICFSGVIPLNQVPEENEYWLLASMFGARCVRALDQRITHLVVAQADTQKVAQALKQPSTKVVWKEWLRHSIDWCQRQPEEAYQVSSFGRPDRSAPSTPTKKQNAPIEPVQTTPSTPSVQERTEPVHMDVTDFDDIDDELKEFMEDDDDEDDEDDATTVDGSESGMSEQSPLASPNKKRARKSHLHENTVEGEEYDSQSEDGDGMPQFSPEQGLVNTDKPLTKRARLNDDTQDEHGNEFQDVEEEHRDEDYDEYLDEGGASELEDAEEYKPDDPDTVEPDEGILLNNAAA